MPKATKRIGAVIMAVMLVMSVTATAFATGSSIQTEIRDGDGTQTSNTGTVTPSNSPGEVPTDATPPPNVTESPKPTQQQTGNVLAEDKTPPTIKLAIEADILKVTVRDNHSGVALVYVGNEYFQGAAGTVFSIQLKTYAREEFIYISAEDYAGNLSNTTIVANPYYEGYPGTIIGNLPGSAIGSKTSGITQSGYTDVGTGERTTANLKLYPISEGVSNDEYVQYFTIRDGQNPENIEKGNVTIDGVEYIYSYSTIYNIFNVESKPVSETIEAVTATNNFETNLSNLEETRQYNDGTYVGTMFLQTDQINTADGEKKTSYGTATQTRTYPGLSNADSSFVPKSITHNGSTYNMSNLSWSSDNGVVDYNGVPNATSSYTATATYSRSYSSTSTINYNLAATYAGTAYALSENAAIYEIHYELAPIPEPEPEPVVESNTIVSFAKDYPVGFVLAILAILGIIAAIVIVIINKGEMSFLKDIVKTRSRTTGEDIDDD